MIRRQLGSNADDTGQVFVNITGLSRPIEMVQGCIFSEEPIGKHGLCRDNRSVLILVVGAERFSTTQILTKRPRLTDCGLYGENIAHMPIIRRE